MNEGCQKPLPQHLEQIRSVIVQDVVGIVLLATSNLECFALNERMFRESEITPGDGAAAWRYIVS